MSAHVMLDLETLGTEPDSVIIAIGAVKFDPNVPAHEVTDSFYCAVDPASCQQHGLKIDARTVMWWLANERQEAREALLAGEMLDLPSVLEGFRMWYGQESLPTWGNGAAFDNVLLAQAYKAIGSQAPWKFWHDRCYRTLKNLVPAIVAKPSDLIAHHALQDAMGQAYIMKDVVNHLGIVL